MSSGYGITIGGHHLDPQPSKMQVDIMDISVASRNTNGDMLIDRINTKRKILCEWAMVANSQLPTILGAVNEVFFQVTYPDPYTGDQETRTFYCGDRSMPIYQYNGGDPLWQGVKFDLIEK